MTLAPPRAPQQLPVPPAPPVTPSRRRTPIWAVSLVVLGSLLMLTGTATLVASHWLIGTTTNAVDRRDLLGNTHKTSAEGGGDNLAGPIDILLMGVDARK